MAKLLKKLGLIKPEFVKRILVVNLGGIGDILLSTPALRALKNFYSQADISMLLVPRVCDLVKDLSYVSETFIFYVNYSAKFSLDNVFKNLKTLLVLRKRDFDLAINMRTIVSKWGALKIRFLLNIIKPKVKAGRDTEGRGRFFDVRIPEKDIGQRYEMDYDIEMVRALGAEVMDRNIDFEIDNSSLKKVNQILEEEGISKDDILVGVHPGGIPSHRWPIENFSHVIVEIHKKKSCKFVVTGGRDELSLANKLKKITNTEIIDLTDRLSIKELGVLIKRCRLYISNDTGPMHIAAVLKTPLVAIFGPGYIVRYDPRNISDKAIVFYKKQDCAPCNRITCESIRCLKMILPEEVISSSLGLIKTE